MVFRRTPELNSAGNNDGVCDPLCSALVFPVQATANLTLEAHKEGQDNPRWRSIAQGLNSYRLGNSKFQLSYLLAEDS